MDINRNARSILITAAIASLLAALYYFALAVLLNEWRYLAMGGATLVLTLFAAGGLLRLRAGHLHQAVWMLILGGDLVFIAPVTVFSNASLLFAPAIILLIVLIALIAFSKSRERNRAIYSALASALINLAADQIWPFERIPLPTPLVFGIGSLIIAVILLYVIFFFRFFSHLTLRAKTTALIASLVILTVAFVSGLHIFYTRATLLQTAQASLYNAAESTAASIDNFILSTLTAMRAEAQTPILPEFLSLSPQDADAPRKVEEVTGTLLSYKDKNPIFISSYALLNMQGHVLISTEGNEIGKDESRRDYFQKPVQDGLPIFSVWYSENSLYFSAPVRDENNAIVGVLRARYSASFLQQMIVQNSGLAGEKSFAVLLDEHHVILAHGTYADTIFKSLVPLDAKLLSAWQNEGRYPAGDAAVFTINLPEVEKRLREADRQPFFEVTDVQGVRQQAVAVRLNQQPWTLIFAQPQQVFLAPINRQINRSILLAISAAILAAYMSLGLSRLLTNPILRLTETARQITAGDLTQQAIVDTRDEIGDLAHAFNEMTSRLRDLIATLEQRVAERTRDLELRSSYLQGTAEVGRAIAITLDPQALMQQAVDLIQERFGLYYVGLFELDGSGEWANLRAGTGKAGRAMLARSHRIRVGAGMIGWSIANNRPRIAQQAELDEVRLRPPELPNTRSEAALPLRARGQTLGALSIQSDQPNFFNEDNLAIFQILADQIGVAMENARLFVESRAAIESLQRLSVRQTQAAWSAMAGQPDTRLAIRADGRSITHTSPTLDDAMRRTLERGEITLAVNEQSSGTIQILLIPIKVRGVVLGALRTYKHIDQGKWTETEIQTLNAIVERLALALDNARLLRESQRRAAKEAKIGEVSAKIGASINMRNVLQTAVEELGRALPGSDVIIQFGDADGEGNE
ncbi:MAG: GAF domain-containing protein [Chloroflexota bacterium]